MALGSVETSAGSIHYVRAGRGRPLLLIGSAGRSARMFRGLVEELGDVFDLIAPDTPGFGRSGPLRAGTGLPQIGDAFFELLDALGVGEVAIYGLHTGNKIATAMAVRRPDRVRRLIVAGQSHSLVPDQEARNAVIRDIIASYVDVDGGPAETPPRERLRQIAGLVAGEDTAETHPVLGGSMIDHVLDAAQARGTAALYLANFDYDLGGEWSRVAVPTLVLEIATEAETRTIGRQGEAVCRLIVGAELETFKVPDGEALTLEDRPRQLAATIRRFLG